MARVMPTVGKRAKGKRVKSRLERLRRALENALKVLNQLNEEDLNALGSNARLRSIDASLKKLNQRPFPAP